MNILIVDDCADDRKLLRYLCEHHDCTVLEAGNGQEGFDIATRHRPDIIISDALMPVMDGFQFLRALRADATLKGIPFIFYTANYTGQEESGLAGYLGADAFMVKPAQLDDLWQQMCEIVHSRPHGDEATPPAVTGMDEETFLREYSRLVATKLEKKVRELEDSLALRHKAEEEIRSLNVKLEDHVRERTAALEQKTVALEESRRALVNLVEDLNIKSEQLRQANESLAAEILQRQQAEASIKALNEDLMKQKCELENVNAELESFSYSVSHDLKAPLRHIRGYLDILDSDYRHLMDDDGCHYLARINLSCGKMERLIEALLKLARITSSGMNIGSVNLGAMAEEIIEALQRADPERQVVTTVAEEMLASGDESLLRALLENLLGNAWKYTRNRERAEVEFGSFADGGKTVYYLRDNGAGFDMAYADRLFTAFQRLHTDAEFEGTGIGLATVRRIISRHGGTIWAEGEPGKGATFYFTLA
jgi:signal transduction histidine kinase